MQSKSEVQGRIWQKTKLLYKLAGAIDRLPPSNTREEIEAKHDRLLMELNSLEMGVVNTDKDACYYGFTHKCTGLPCVCCPYWEKVRDGA